MNEPSIQFGDEPEPPPQPQQTPLSAIESVLSGLDQAQTAALLEEIQEKVTSPSQDAMAAANQLRQDAAHELEDMAWTNGYGDRIPLKLTSYKYSQYERLRRLSRGPDAPAVITENEAMANRYVDAGLLLFLCSPGTVAFINEGAPKIMEVAAEWMDHNIPLGRQDESLRVANRLLDLIDLFVPVARKSEDDTEEDAPQKKTPLQEGNPVTSPLSASR